MASTAFSLALVLAVGVPASALSAGQEDAAEDAPRAPRAIAADAARTSLSRGLRWMVDTQNADGSWASGALESLLEEGFALESFYAWQMASCAIACTALLECPESTERRAALERGLEWLCTSRLPKRGEDWDIDYVWTMLYGFDATVRALQDPRFADEAWQSRLRGRAKGFYDLLETHQAIDGGWGYYDNPPYPQRPLWATSFSTACVIPALLDASELDLGVDPAVARRAVAYVKGCALPNGAFAYGLRPIPRSSAGESIDAIKGSLGRIQVCNWALVDAGEAWVTPDKLREGLTAFFEHHVFLDVARLKPIPHEAYYANSGYFYFFGHYYAALVIELLPEPEREAWHQKLRWHIVKTQADDGSLTDFQGSSYLRVACTAFACLALNDGLGL